MRSVIAIVLVSCFAGRTEAQQASRITPDNRAAVVPKGKEVDAIDNDFVIRNDYLTAVVADNKRSRNANMTVRKVAGALIDLTENDSNSDQLSAFYPGRRSQVWVGAAVGSGQEHDTKFSTAHFFNSDESVRVDYRLEPDAKRMLVRTTFVNRTNKPRTFKLEDDIRADGGKEYMKKTPNGDVDLFWIYDRFWGQAYGVVSKHGQIRCNGNSRESVLRYLVDGKTTVEVEPGEEFVLDRWIFPAASLLDIRAIDSESRGEALRSAKFVIKDRFGRVVPRAHVVFTRDSKPYGDAVTRDDGTLETRLPPGSYQLTVTAMGEGLGPRRDIEVEDENASFAVTFDQYGPGTVKAAVTAEDGSPIPCKIELRPQEGTPTPDFGPETAEFGVKNLIYSPNGTCERPVPAGKYDVIVSRGPEYDAIFTQLDVPAGKTVSLTGKLVRSVKSPGWVSCDYHSHSSPSGDNTGSQLGRVLNLAAENIEFAPCTEHNRVSTYSGHIASQELNAFMATVSGMELTGSPLPLNHQNVFPMVYRPYQQDGGGPVTDVSPEKQIERLAFWDERSRKLIQQNHPDMGWLFYDKNGDGKPDGGYERSFDHMDVIEIHPVASILKLGPFDMNNGRPTRNNCVFNWLQLLNQGRRIYGIVNTDAHYNFHGSGWLRNWIKSSTDDPTKIDIDEMVANSEAGALVMSNGPYLEATVSEADGKQKAIAGQDLTARSGKLKAHIRVQCANWLDIDRVFVLVNGRERSELKFTRKKNPGMFGDGVVKFDHTIDIELEDDAHLVVATGHATRRLGPVMGPSAGRRRIAAFTNPIFVNVKGDLFTPNKDTLGHPLPVKKSPR